MALGNANQRDPLSEMTGGYAPNSDTPTHFFGREQTREIISRDRRQVHAARKKAYRKKMALAQSRRAKKIVREKVAPGITIAYEVDAGCGSDKDIKESAENENLMQTENPEDTPDSSLHDQRTVSHRKADREDYPSHWPVGPGIQPAGDYDLDPHGEEENPPEPEDDPFYMPTGPKQGQTHPGTDTYNESEQDLSMGEVPAGDDMVTPELDIETSQMQNAMEGSGTSDQVQQPAPRAGYSSRRTAEDTLAEEREEEKENQVEPDPDEAFATAAVGDWDRRI